jgi:hypothetical protein
MIRSPNEIYEDTIVKTTINIDKDMMLQVKGRMRDLHLKHFSVYMRALIDQDLRSSRKQIISLTDFLGMEPRDPPRKYSGFTSGLKRSHWVFTWLRKKKNNC